MEKNKKTGIARLMEITLMSKLPIISSLIFSVLASIASFVPYIAIYLAVVEIVAVYPNFELLNGEVMLFIGFIAILGVLANVVFYFIALYLSHLGAYETIAKLKEEFASHISKLPLGFHINMGSGKLRKIMEKNIDGLEGFIAHDFSNMVSAIVSPIVMLVLVFSVDFRFGLMVFLGIVVSLIVQGITSPKKEKSKILVEGYQSALSDMSSASVEYVRGISVVKAFGQTAFSFKRLSLSIQNYTSSVVPYSLSQENMTAAFTSVLFNIYLFLVPMAIFVGSNTKDYPRFVSSFIFYLIFVPAIGPILMKVVYSLVNANQSAIEINEMDNILNMEEMIETTNSKKPLNYDVEFKNVDFIYEGYEQKALNNVSFIARQGQSTAIVGPSGGGKSTIANLIPRFYDVVSGSITIGGIDIKDMSMSDLMDTVSFVFQDNFLFKKSIFENIRIGRPLASEKEVVEAAKAAQCDEFIQRLPEGYNSIYGKNGVYLSGGEVQRIAIARAILKGTPILVLDEATAFADIENEHIIQKALEKLMVDKTVIMIAHRLSTISNVDQILVMEDGILKERGNHEELILKGQRYKELVSKYRESLEWKIEKGGFVHE